MKEYTIAVDDVEKRFPPALAGWRALLQPMARPTMPALRGISLHVARGEAFALIGANGAGKSTLLRILATLLIPTRGRASVGGADVEREPARVRRAIGYHSGADPGFYHRLTVRENLQFFAAMNRLFAAEAAQRIADVVELMDLGETLDRPVRMLSTGMVTRLSLARALVHSPAVLLLDEPTRSLDPLAAAEFRRFLKDKLVRGRGTTLLFASHTLSEVEDLAGRAGLLESGRLIACDTPQGLRASSGAATLEEAVRRLLGRDS